MRCPNCHNNCIQEQEEGVRVRAKKSLLFKSDGCHIACYWCGVDIVLPLTLQHDTQPVWAKAQDKRFYVVLRKKNNA